MKRSVQMAGQGVPEGTQRGQHRRVAWRSHRLEREHGRLGSRWERRQPASSYQIPVTAIVDAVPLFRRLFGVRSRGRS